MCLLRNFQYLVLLHFWQFIRLYHKCEGGKEKSVPRITDQLHKACLVLTKGNREGKIFLLHPHTNNKFVFLLTINLLQNLSLKYEFAGIWYVCN